MKKLILLTALVSSTVFASNHNANVEGGFSGPVTAVNSVKAVLDAGIFSDDTAVVLTGYLVASLGDENYTFKDNSGEVSVEIDTDKWSGLQVTPAIKVTLYGEIDKGLFDTKVDVERVSLAQ